MVDRPGPRKVHLQPMPLLGGVAIGCVLVLYPFLSALLWAGILVYTT